MKIQFSRKAAFTLVEIMIVVAIIGLLAGIAIPNFIKARETARKNACINNLRLIDSAIQQWALESNKNGTDNVVLDSLSPYLNRSGGQINGTGTGAVKCPSGGTYSVSTVDTKPTCSKSADGHSI
ncbi:MAG TPA: prepilin-type N-terminal cleavage/methylation domain-containing protein [Verrucomicrobiae bacterium]|nr:prepilin-type N-terminal cleavage/methylation domain-containing protein [Verrucomicrobiae bacterium]